MRLAPRSESRGGGSSLSGGTRGAVALRPNEKYTGKGAGADRPVLEYNHPPMGLKHTIDRDRRTVFVTLTGEMDISEIADIGRQLRADPDFDDAFQLLLDLQDLTPPNFFYTDLQRIAHESDPFTSRSRRALVAPEGLMFALARMYQLMQGDENIRVFHTRGEGLVWLGLEPDI